LLTKGGCDSGTKALYAGKAGALALIVSTSVRVGMSAGIRIFQFGQLTILLGNLPNRDGRNISIPVFDIYWGNKHDEVLTFLSEETSGVVSITPGKKFELFKKIYVRS
jgi:hypothetical protein